MVESHPTGEGSSPCTIRRWFAECDDGDFSLPTRDSPYLVVPPSGGSARVLYSTKPQCVLALLSRMPSGFPGGLVGRCGLPDEDDLPWLRLWADRQRLLFLGDADPCDLLIYAWLRSRLDITYCGLSDSLLHRIGVNLDDACIIPQESSEMAAVRLVTEHLPDLAALVGERCAEIIRSGRKIEVELLVSKATISPDSVLRALAG